MSVFFSAEGEDGWTYLGRAKSIAYTVVDGGGVETTPNGVCPHCRTVPLDGEPYVCAHGVTLPCDGPLMG